MAEQEYEKLTEEEVQIKVAELNGWQGLRGKAYGWAEPIGENPEGELSVPPDYLHDLNACHEMIKGLTQKQIVRYINWLLELAGENHGGMSEATAAQRCKAFVLTMTEEI